jgi:hypothetical protein
MALQKRESVMLAAGAAVLLVAAAWWCHGWMTEKRRAAKVAAADLAECRSDAIAILSARGRVKTAPGGDAGETDLGRRVDLALAAAQINSDSLDGVIDQPPRPAGDSAYLIQPTRLRLSGVSLGQLSAFLYHLTDGSGLSVRDIRLQVPRGETARTAWDAEATVTCMVSAPPTRTRR